MQLFYGSADSGGEGEPIFTTEVTFMEHERSRARLIAGIERYQISHDDEVFPERIVLMGHVAVKTIHEIITEQFSADKLMKQFTPSGSKSVETVDLKSDYL